MDIPDAAIEWVFKFDKYGSISSVKFLVYIYLKHEYLSAFKLSINFKENSKSLFA